jgi:CheY-like chemotaxis protein
VDVASVIQGALETSETLVRQGGHVVNVSVSGAPLVVHGDPIRLAQVLSNLLSNAARYTPSGGEIDVRAWRDGPHAVVSVRDNGRGIAAEQVPRLFEMFSRGSHSSGLGVGLSLARRLVEMHGGTIEARSDGVGKGAEFTVRLPALPSVPDIVPGRPPAEEPALPAHRILVVDDNQDSADTLGMLLEALGAQVRIAYGGAEALEEFASFQPEIVLLDIGMPDMDGYELAAAIRARPNGSGVMLVAITGWGQDGDRQRARHAGFDHHLTKPADPGALRSLLSSLPRT